MAQSLDTLIGVINQSVKTNGNAEITGSVLNNTLLSMVNSLYYTHFRFPKHDLLVADDIGKLVMNAGDGKAALYQLSEATDIQKGKWYFELGELASNGSNDLAHKEIFLNDITDEDKFEIYFGGLLFAVDISNMPSPINASAAYNPTMSIFRQNVINAINGHPANVANYYATAFAGNNDDEIRIELNINEGDKAVFLGRNKFRWQTSAFSYAGKTQPSTIKIKSDVQNLYINPFHWRNNTIPATVTEELELIADYINNNCSYLVCNVLGNKLTVVESAYHGTLVTSTGFSGSVIADSLSAPALAKAPTAFPLGKLVGIDGEYALISNAFIETYPTSSPITIDHSIFNVSTSLGLTSLEVLQTQLEQYLIVPADNGHVQAVNFSELSFNDEFWTTYRHHLVGIAISASETDVTVINTNYVTLIFNVFAELKGRGIMED